MSKLLGATALLLLLVTGCAAGASIDEPPEILYGQDECERCRMIISDARYAAAYMTEDGQVRRFDDIGGMLLYHVENEENVHLFWVHDFESEVWVNADEAYFVKSNSLETPMGFGIAASNSRAEAEELASERDGDVLTFSRLMDEAAAGDLMPAHADGNGHDDGHSHGDH